MTPGRPHQSQYLPGKLNPVVWWPGPDVVHYVLDCGCLTAWHSTGAGNICHCLWVSADTLLTLRRAPVPRVRTMNELVVSACVHVQGHVQDVL